MWLITDSA
jgi:hypothetical protein